MSVVLLYSIRSNRPVAPSAKVAHADLYELREHFNTQPCVRNPGRKFNLSISYVERSSLLSCVQKDEVVRGRFAR